MSSDCNESSPVDLLIEEFLERQQRGEHPSVDEYCQRHPELAEEIREVFEAVMMVEGLKPNSQDDSPGFGETIRLNGQPLDQVGEYRILREIGRGGMGVVYEAEQPSLSRRVALKVLPRHAAGDGKSLIRFQREARAAARMHHTNIVPVFEVGQDEEHVFYAMQLIRGQGLDLVIDDLRRMRHQSRTESGRRTGSGTLRQPAPSIVQSLVSGQFQQERLLGHEIESRVGSEASASGTVAALAEPEATESLTSGLLSESSASLPGKSDVSTAESNRHAYHHSVAQIGRQVASALSYAHARGIIHRDIKPSNLLLDSLGVVWVTDFGLAKTGDSKMTHTGDILGTIRYMSPERFRGQCDVRADIYSLGLTLYELLTLEPAFCSGDQLNLIERINTIDPVSPRVADPRVPRDLETIVLKAIDKDPKRRYQSADELEEDLQRFLDDEPIRARRVSLSERFARWSRRNKSLAGALAAVAGLLLVINIAGPMITWRMARLNENLERTVVDLQATQAELRNERDMAKAAREAAVASKTEAERERSAALDAQRIALAQKEATARNLYFARINMAHAAVASGDIDQKEKLLSESRLADPSNDQRCFEWYYLLSQGQEDSLILRGHPSHVNEVKWHPDGSRVASGSKDGTIKIWDARSGQLLQTISGYFDEVLGLAWNPDGKRLASTHLNSMVKIWNAESGQELATLAGHTFPVFDVAWSPDGQRLASAGWDGSARVWDAETGQQLTTIEHPGRHVWCIAWHPGGSRLATGCLDDPAIRIWDTSSGEQIETLTAHSRQTLSLAWHPDGQRLASGGTSGEAFLWQLPSQQPVARFMGHGDRAVHAVQWSPVNDRRVLTVGGDTTMRIWDSTTGRQVHAFSGHALAITGGCWSPDGTRIASSSADQTVRIWNVPARVLGASTDWHSTPVESIAWSSDSAHLATGSNDGSLKIWEQSGEKLLHALVDDQQPQNHVRDIAFSPSDQHVASGGDDGFVRIWDRTSGRLIHRLGRHGPQPNNPQHRGVRSVAWSPDGKMLVSSGEDSKVCVWDSQSGERLATFKAAGGSTYEVCFSPDGKWLISGHWINQPIQIWETTNWSRAGEIDSGGIMVRAIQFSPDGKRLAAVGGRFAENRNPLTTDSGTIRIWDWERVLADNRTSPEIDIAGLPNCIWDASWSVDGRRLITGEFNGPARLWDVTTDASKSAERGLMVFQRSSTAGVAARFSPDGSRLALASGRVVDVLDAYSGYVREKSPQLLSALDRRIDAQTASAQDVRLRAEVYAIQGNWDAAAEAFKRYCQLAKHTRSIIAGVWIAGYFPGELEPAYAPEQRFDDRFDPLATLSSANGEVRWQRLDIEPGAPINFSNLLGPSKKQTAYAMFRVFSPQEQRAGLLFGDDDFHRLWINGRLVSEDTVPGPAQPDEFVIPLTLQQGWNSILAKVVDAGQDNSDSHGLILRLSDDPVELATVYMDTDRIPQALEMWDSAIAAHPEDKSLLLKRAKTKWILNDQAGADVDFANFIAGRENDALALESRARTLLTLALVDRGQAEYERAVQADPNSAALRNRIIDSKMFWDRPREAIPHLRAILEMHPDSVMHQNELSLVLLALGDEAGYRELRSKMLTQWSRTTSHDIASIVSLTALLMMPADESELAVATKLARFAAESNVNERERWLHVYAHGAAMHRQAEVAMAHSEEAQARDLFEQAKQLYLATREELPQRSENMRICINYSLAQVLYQLNEHQAARDAFQAAELQLADKKSDFSSAIRYLARMLSGSTRRLLFRRCFEQLALAEQLCLDGEVTYAANAIATALKEAPDSIEVVNEARRIATEQLDSTTWIKVLSEVIERQAEITPLQLERAHQYVRQQAYLEAGRDYIRCSSLAPAPSTHWLRTGSLLALSDDHKAYREYCEQLITEFGSTNQRAEAERLTKVCLIVPGLIEPDRLPIPVIMKELESETQLSFWSPWGSFTLALAAFRANDLHEAERWLQRAEESLPESGASNHAALALIHPLRALILARRREPTEWRSQAEESIRLGREQIDQFISRHSDGSLVGESLMNDGELKVDRIFGEVLCREAERLLDAAESAVP